MRFQLSHARRALRPLVALGILVAGVAACNSDRGIFEPQRGIEGTWLRVPPPSTGINRIMVVGYHDTLTFHHTGAGRWSYEVSQGEGALPARVVTDVVLDPHGTLLFMNFVPCDFCRVDVGNRVRTDLAVPEAPRALSVIGPPHYRIIRRGDDRLELQAVAFPQEVAYYVRLTAATPLPE